MKNLLCLILLSILAIACGDKEQDDLFFNEGDIVGNWRLIETLLDPGDGSGVYKPSTLNVNLEIFDDGSVLSNGMLCGLGESVNGQVQHGQFYVEDSLITSSCDSLPYSLGVNHIDTILILSYPCIEPCLVKFEKSL